VEIKLLLRPRDRLRSIVKSASVSQFVCLSVCTTHDYLRNHTHNGTIFTIFCACCLCPWLGPPPSRLRQAASPIAGNGFSSPLAMHYNTFAAKGIIISPITPHSTRDHSVAAAFPKNRIDWEGSDRSAQRGRSVIYDCLVL